MPIFFAGRETWANETPLEIPESPSQDSPEGWTSGKIVFVDQQMTIQIRSPDPTQEPLIYFFDGFFKDSETEDNSKQPDKITVLAPRTKNGTVVGEAQFSFAESKHQVVKIEGQKPGDPIFFVVVTEVGDPKKNNPKIAVQFLKWEQTPTRATSSKSNPKTKKPLATKKRLVILPLKTIPDSELYEGPDFSRFSLDDAGLPWILLLEKETNSFSFIRLASAPVKDFSKDPLKIDNWETTFPTDLGDSSGLPQIRIEKNFADISFDQEGNYRTHHGFYDDDHPSPGENPLPNSFEVRRNRLNWYSKPEVLKHIGHQIRNPIERLSGQHLGGQLTHSTFDRFFGNFEGGKLFEDTEFSDLDGKFRKLHLFPSATFNLTFEGILGALGGLFAPTTTDPAEKDKFAFINFPKDYKNSNKNKLQSVLGGVSEYFFPKDAQPSTRVRNFNIVVTLPDDMADPIKKKLVEDIEAASYSEASNVKSPVQINLIFVHGQESEEFGLGDEKNLLDNFFGKDSEMKFLESRVRLTLGNNSLATTVIQEITTNPDPSLWTDLQNLEWALKVELGRTKKSVGELSQPEQKQFASEVKRYLTGTAGSPVPKYQINQILNLKATLSSSSPVHGPDPLFGLDHQLERLQDILLVNAIAGRRRGASPLPIWISGPSGGGKTLAVRRVIQHVKAASKWISSSPDFGSPSNIFTEIDELKKDPNPLKILVIDEVEKNLGVLKALFPNIETQDAVLNSGKIVFQGIQLVLIGNVQTSSDAFKRLNMPAGDNNVDPNTVHTLLVDTLINEINEKNGIAKTFPEALVGRFAPSIIYFPRMSLPEAEQRNLLVEIVQKYASSQGLNFHLPEGVAEKMNTFASNSPDSFRGFAKELQKILDVALSELIAGSPGDPFDQTRDFQLIISGNTNSSLRAQLVPLTPQQILYFKKVFLNREISDEIDFLMHQMETSNSQASSDARIWHLEFFENFKRIGHFFSARLEDSKQGPPPMGPETMPSVWASLGHGLPQESHQLYQELRDSVDRFLQYSDALDYLRNQGTLTEEVFRTHSWIIPFTSPENLKLERRKEFQNFFAKLKQTHRTLVNTLAEDKDFDELKASLRRMAKQHFPELELPEKVGNSDQFLEESARLMTAQELGALEAIEAIALFESGLTSYLRKIKNRKLKPVLTSTIVDGICRSDLGQITGT